MTLVDTVVEALIAAATDRPQALAYAVEGEPISYGALAADATSLAARLRTHVSRGARCAVLLPTSLDFIRAVYAVQMAGAVPVAIDPDLPGEAIRRRLELVRAELALCTAPAMAAIREGAGTHVPCRLLTLQDAASVRESSTAAAMPDPGEPAFLQLTSGTTGEPRAAVVSHRSLMASLEATARRLDVRTDDVLATWVPLHHDLGLVRYVFGAMLAGCPSHLIRPSIVHLQPWLELVSRVRATITGAPDSAYRLAARTVSPASVDLRSLRFAGNGGETVRLTTIEQFEHRFGLRGVVRPAYGLAEATLTVASTAPGEALRVDAAGGVSCGRALDGIELRIADAERHSVAPGTVGEVLVRGTPVFDGYFDDEAATRHALRDGWLHTGDLGCLDEQGHLFLKGRSRVLIKRGGVAIAPREIEDVVDRLSDLRGSAAVGVAGPSESGTEEVVVVAEVRSPPTPAEAGALIAAIGGAVRRSLGWAPGRIFLVPPGALPRTAAGKVRYDELRRMVIERTLPPLPSDAD